MWWTLQRAQAHTPTSEAIYAAFKIISLPQSFAPSSGTRRRLCSLEDAHTLHSQPTETDRYSYFYTLWALKESFVKAIGLGIGYPLAELHFDVVFDLQASPSAPLQAGSTTTPATVAVPHAPFRGSATVRIRGEERRDWSFELFSIGETHTVAVARGPFTDAIDHFASCLPLSSHKYDSTVVVEPLPPLRILTPDELLPTVPAHRFDQSLDDAQHSAAEHGLCKCTVA
jgi:hypothetical protein